MYAEKFINTDNLSDEAWDELYPERPVNTLKSAAALCIYFVLRDHSSEKRHLTQQQILNYLEDEYEIVMERKALSRTLGTITLLDGNVFSTPRSGAWMQQPTTHKESALSGSGSADLLYSGQAA